MSRSALSRFFWPPVIDGDYLNAARKRCLLVISIAAALVGLASGLRNFDNSFSLYPLQTMIAILGPLVFLICPVLLARISNVRGVAWFFLVYSYLGFITVALIAGGMFSRTVFFMLPWAVMATLFLGWKEGMGAAIVVFCTYLALHFFRADIPPSVYDISADMISHWMLIALSLTLVMLTAGAAIFQREMERAAVKLSEARAEAEAASLAKSEFLAKMSHEIRTPMNGVLGLAEALESTELTDQQRLFTETISSSGESLLAIINDILDLSKVEAGRLSLESKPFELKSFIEQISILFKSQANRNQIALLVDFDEALPRHVIGDAGRIRQILINLVGNALKFTNVGCIKIKVSGGATGSMADLAFAIEDTGIGIPADRLDDIFSKFEQVEGSTTRRFDGAGLGLAISRQLAQEMGGDITVQSVHGNGSTFTFEVSLPIAQTTAGKTVDAPSVESGPDKKSVERADLQHNRIRVLAAEDNEVNRLVLKSMIDAGKYHVTFAVNGLEAFYTYKSGQYDIVLMDISMPEMDGHKATREIRKYEAETGATRTPIICVTAHAFAAQREKSLEIGMDDFLPKPATGAQISAMLSKWTGVARGAQNVA